MPFVAVPDAIEEIRAGRILVVVDDEDRENEGDLTIAAEKVTPEIINFMAVQGRGLICLALTPERCDYLRLPLMSPTNTSMFGTAFCESIDARDGVTTGISAADRTRTILQVVDPACRAADLARYVWTVCHGLVVQAVGGATRDQLRRVVDLAMRAWPE